MQQMAGSPKVVVPFLKKKLAPVSVVLDAGNATIAADFDSGLDFVQLLDLGGGMPTRVNIPQKRLHDALRKIRAVLAERAQT